jgi:citrate synthase
MKSIIDGFPKTTSNGCFVCIDKRINSFNPKSVNVENEKEMYEAVCKTMGKFLVIATWTYRKVWVIL